MRCFEIRVDSAFFKQDFLQPCDFTGVEYAVNVPMWPWLYLHGIVKRHAARDWQWVFNPDDSYWEYSLVATNKTLGLRALWDFQAGRGVQEKTIGELKSGYAFGSIPTLTYSANTAWQKLNILAHDVMTTFRITSTATRKPRTAKRTTLFLLRSIATLRVEWLKRAARWHRPGGRSTLRLAHNDATRKAVEKIEAALGQAA